MLKPEELQQLNQTIQQYLIHNKRLDRPDAFLKFLINSGTIIPNTNTPAHNLRGIILEKLLNEQYSLELLSEISNKLADPNNQLITKDNSETETLLDIIREELIISWEKLRNWVEKYQEFLPLEKKIEADAAQWETDGKKEDLLLRGGELTKTEEYLTKYGEMALLNGVAYEFIEVSRELRKSLEREEEKRKKREFEQEQKTRRLAQRRNQILGISLVLMTGVSAFGLVQQNIAKHNAKVSLARQMAAQAQAVIANSNLYDVGTLLAIQSIDKVQELQKEQQVWWQKIVKNFLGDRFEDIPQNEADRAIRKGLTQLPNHLHTLNHKGIVKVSFSPDDKIIATGSWGVYLWDADTRQKLATLNYQDYDHQGIVQRIEYPKYGSSASVVVAVAFSPEGKTIAIASPDGTVRLWDIDTGKELATLNYQGMIKAVAFSPDGQTIAIGSSYNTARLWDAETGKELATLNHQDSDDFWGLVWAVAFSPDGKTIATASSDNTARLWDTDTGKELATFNHQAGVKAVAFSPDGKTIATASHDNTARLWDVETGKELATLNHSKSVQAVAFSPDGKTIATASSDKTARLWDTDTGKELATFNHQGGVYAVAFSPDGKSIVTRSYSTVRLWDADTGKELATFNHQGTVKAVAFSKDGQTIATGAWDDNANLWDADTRQELATLNHQAGVKAVALSKDGKTIVTISDNTARLWDAENSKELATLKHQDNVYAVTFSPDGKTIATASWDKTARLWDTDTGKELATFNHQHWVYAVAFSPDGKTIATASNDNTARLWDAETGQELATLNHQNAVRAVAFSPDGKTIATASNDGTSRLWDAETGQELATLNHQSRVNAVAFSPDGKTIATGTRDNTVHLWDTDTGKELATLNHQDGEGFSGLAAAVAFSPDGKTIATTTGSDFTARLWDAETGQELATLNHQHWVNTVAFSPDGKTIATASSDYTARLWDTDTGKELATFNHQDTVFAVAFSPDGKTIATASSDNTARLHRVMPKDLIPEACRRLRRNLTAQEWQKYMNSGLEKYERTCDELPVHPSVIAEAKVLARTGEKQKIKKAISIFKRALELEPEIDLYPDTEIIETDPKLVANKFTALGIVTKGKKLARQRKIEEAISFYEQAKQLDSDVEIDGDDWAALCWLGSLNNQAQDVLFACEKAVKLKPNDVGIWGVRGVAKALTGDSQGAIDDFQVFVDSTKYPKEKAVVEGWIETLKKGENLSIDKVWEQLKN